MALERHTVFFKPSNDWMTSPTTLAAQGNPEMLKAVQEGYVAREGDGASVIEGLARLFRQRGQRVILLESSEALARVTKDLSGSKDPDDVFSVDYVGGYEFVTPRNPELITGTLHHSEGGKLRFVNIMNRMTTPTRWLEPDVAIAALLRLGVKNILMQATGVQFEGGDFTFLPHAFGDDRHSGLLITGSGPNSRSNGEGRNWLHNLFLPRHTLNMEANPLAINIESSKFHRDLVSVFVQDHQGRLAAVILAEGGLLNEDMVLDRLRNLRVPIIRVPKFVVQNCALNLAVRPGELIGMQVHQELLTLLPGVIPKRIQFSTLAQDLQPSTVAFTRLQGGANCVSGSILADPDEIDTSEGSLQEVNAYLHSKDFEDQLRATAEELGMREALAETRRQQQPRTAVMVEKTEERKGPIITLPLNCKDRGVSQKTAAHASSERAMTHRNGYYYFSARELKAHEGTLEITDSKNYGSEESLVCRLSRVKKEDLIFIAERLAHVDMLVQDGQAPFSLLLHLLTDLFQKLKGKEIDAGFLESLESLIAVLQPGTQDALKKLEFPLGQLCYRMKNLCLRVIAIDTERHPVRFRVQNLIGEEFEIRSIENCFRDYTILSLDGNSFSGHPDPIELPETSGDRPTIPPPSTPPTDQPLALAA